ncbi:hypothetical protein BTA51_22950 [Hahella sp. CCB-MM4]|uniref:AHH domain-containing protein n=1 Tax=Hahella sp. (strain CCB-MM4) TaxID=1926491 RepID=UPI000B9B4A85|nr:AHH domain-containing protein [Hahella sp. CCB-MM4]OZG70968.1 hypothetical protein BTA51_22950 [Hahella sp. CCB-MM4]
MAKKKVIKKGDDNYDKKLIAFEDFKVKFEKAKKKKPVKHDKNAPHLASQTLFSGNIVKGQHYYENKTGQECAVANTYYAYNGWVYLGDNPPSDRKIYDSPSKDFGAFYSEEYKPNFYQKFPIKSIETTKTSAFLKLAQATITPGKQLDVRYLRNVCDLLDKRKGYIGQSLPYHWEAHHVLPMSCFLDYFSAEELQIILLSDYDINDGRNIIFLPVASEDTAVHDLPYHPSNHLKYNKEVKSEFKKIKDKIKELKDEQKPHEAIAASVEDQLHLIETDMFEYVKDFGTERLD